MSRKITVVPAEQENPKAPQNDSNVHFDSVEAEFFEEGHDDALRVAEGDYIDEQGVQKWFALSRQFYIGLAVGGALGALVFAVVFSRNSGHSRTASSEPVALNRAMAPTAPASLANSANLPQTGEQPREPSETAVTASAHKETVAVVPTADADAEGVARAAKAATTLPLPTHAAPEVENIVRAVAPAIDLVQPMVAAAAEAASSDAEQACNKAIADRQKNRILTACEEAFVANPRAANIAVVLAKLEFDRGRIAQAFEWSNKAIAANPDVADAYVYVGEAQQYAGHKRAAKDAYLHYLRLAPGGRYAADLRAVLRSL
jgi:tetratricopeptide (TPR) repeat protein